MHIEPMKKLEIEPRKNAEPKAKKGGLSQLLGKRRCAAEANERIARAANQVSLNVAKKVKIYF